MRASKGRDPFELRRATSMTSERSASCQPRCDMYSFELDRRIVRRVATSKDMRHVHSRQLQGRRSCATILKTRTRRNRTRDAQGSAPCSSSPNAGGRRRSRCSRIAARHSARLHPRQPMSPLRPAEVSEGDTIVCRTRSSARARCHAVRKLPAAIRARPHRAPSPDRPPRVEAAAM